MIFDSNVSEPVVGQAVYYYNPRVCPRELYAGLVKSVTRTEVVVLIPELHGVQGFHGDGWGHENPNNLITFTWRKSRMKWGEKGDGYGSCCLLFPDAEEANHLKGTFSSLGGV